MLRLKGSESFIYMSAQLKCCEIFKCSICILYHWFLQVTLCISDQLDWCASEPHRLITRVHHIRWHERLGRHIVTASNGQIWQLYHAGACFETKIVANWWDIRLDIRVGNTLESTSSWDTTRSYSLSHICCCWLRSSAEAKQIISHYFCFIYW